MWLLQDQARSAGQRDSRLYLWKVFVEAAVHYMSVLLKSILLKSSQGGISLWSYTSHPSPIWSMEGNKRTLDSDVSATRKSGAQSAVRPNVVRSLHNGGVLLPLSWLHFMSMPLHFLSFFTLCQYFLFQKISEENLKQQKSCRSSTRNSHVPFTKGELLTFAMLIWLSLILFSRPGPKRTVRCRHHGSSPLNTAACL